MTEGELGKRVYLDSGTLAPLLKRMEKQGYITRIRPETNERRLFVELTAAGEALKDQATEVPCEMEGCLKLPQDELLQLKVKKYEKDSSDFSRSGIYKGQTASLLCS